MDEMDYWRLCEDLNIVQAALLIVGEDAEKAEYVERWDLDKRPKGYEAAKTALCSGLKNFVRFKDEYEKIDLSRRGFDDSNLKPIVVDDYDELVALRNRAISGELWPESDINMNGDCVGVIDNTVDVYKSTIRVDSLKLFLAKKGFSKGFFFPEPQQTTDFLDPLNPRYAPKLAAAVHAWQAVTDPGKKSPKQALDKWLREHAVEFNLTNDEGKPIETAIEECSKVANWNTKGGATKTAS